MPSPEEHVDRIVNRAFNEAEQLREEMHMPKKTFAKGIIGAAISAVLSGVLVAGFCLQAGFFSLYLLIGVWFFSYGFIRVFTKKSGKNDHVILLSMFSTLVAILIAVFVFNMYGVAYLDWVN